MTRSNSLARELEEVEDQRDALALQLARMQAANEERLPAALVRRLTAGETPLKVWRDHRGLTVRALAEAAGVSPSLLSEIETGRKDGSIHTLMALARALRVDLDDLVSWPAT